MDRRSDEALRRLQGCTVEVDGQHFLSIRVGFRKPDHFEYVITGLAEDSKYDNRALRKQKVQALGGSVAHNFSFAIDGNVYSPEELRDVRCSLSVNVGPGATEYVRALVGGDIGKGRFVLTDKGAVMECTMSVAPDIARNMIEQRLIAERVHREWEPEADRGNKSIWMRAGLVLLNLEQHGHGAVFDIIEFTSQNQDAGYREPHGP
jgi:hypothetical protein